MLYTIFARGPVCKALLKPLGLGPGPRVAQALGPWASAGSSGTGELPNHGGRSRTRACVHQHTRTHAHTHTRTHANARTQQMPELEAAAGYVSVIQVTASPNSRCALKFLSLRHRGGDTLTECTAFTAFTACAALTAFTACTAHSQHAPRLLVFAVPCSRHLIGCAWLCMGGGQVRAT
jgi:hypothetical protein